jgi:hypothetical protein
MDASLVTLDQKIDALAAQVAFLTEQAQLAERQRQERTEMLRDLTPIADQAYQMTIAQLEEIQEYVDLNDLLRLAKRLLRNGRNLEKMLDQLESLMGLAETVGPLADEAFGKAVDTLANSNRRVTLPLRAAACAWPRTWWPLSPKRMSTAWAITSS